MSRKLIAVAVTLAMPVAAVCAPLVHAHLDDHAHGHRIHAHLSGHASHHDEGHGHSRSSEEPALAAKHHHADEHGDPAATFVAADDSSERATSVPLYVAVQKDVLLQPVLPPASFAMAAPLRSVLRRPPDVVRSHGPPVVRLSPSRAPPSFAA